MTNLNALIEHYFVDGSYPGPAEKLFGAFTRYSNFWVHQVREISLHLPLYYCEIN